MNKGRKLYVARWYGGSGYSHGDPVEALEWFGTKSAISDALKDRYEHGYSWFQRFNYCNRDPESVLTPCVELDSEMWVWSFPDYNWVVRSWDDDGKLTVPDYPDFVVMLGKFGGVRWEVG